MKIFIDAGHNFGGWDTGSEANGLREQDINFKVSKILADMLLKVGFKVMLSRNSLTHNLGADLASSLGARYKAANSWGADLFISIHCNAYSSSVASGTESLVFSETSKAYTLAKMISSNISDLGLINRGVKIRPDISVLRYTNMPAVLVELAFVTNAHDAEFLANRQEELARAICKAVLDYTGVDDVQNTHWAKKYFDFLKSKGIEIHEETFDRNITRGEVFRLLALVLGFKE
ncbi:MAG: N-acetylmuramoyl-L-alanine amidase [Eubacteriales bacterium]|nr:N-acetylmuramoyl-L-alanine amidase [Eubacteriales bacterium]